MYCLARKACSSRSASLAMIPAISFPFSTSSHSSFISLPIGKEIKELWEEVENGNEIAGIIAKDADLLEQAFLAKQYMEQGYKDCQNWIDNIAKFIITDSAKNLLKTLQKTDSNEWRQHLKKVKKA